MSDPIIDVSHLTKKFGEFTAVDEVSFRVSEGEIFGYLGANGAGKSTTIRMLCGLLKPTSGKASVARVDVRKNPTEVKRRIGYMSQKFSLYLDLTVEENLSFFAGVYRLRGKRRRSRIEAALELSGLTARRSQLTGSLPGGVRQRLALASALLHEPEILYLDEPTAGVDPVSRREFWRVIRRLANEGTTLFVTTHHLDEAEYCGRVGLMVDGRLVALDTPNELKSKHVPGTIHAVTGASKGALTEALKKLSGVLSVRTFGAGTHVRVEGPMSDPQKMQAALHCEPGLENTSVEPAEATLEDVFLELVGAHSGGDEGPRETLDAPSGEEPPAGSNNGET